MGCGASSEHDQSRVVMVQPAAQQQSRQPALLPQQLGPQRQAQQDLLPSTLRQLPQVEGVRVVGENPLGATARGGGGSVNEQRCAEPVAGDTAGFVVSTHEVLQERMQNFLRGLGVRDSAVQSNAESCLANGIKTPAQFELLGRVELRNLAFHEDDIERLLREMSSRSEQDQELVSRAIAESLKHETELQAPERQLHTQPDQDQELVNRAIAASLQAKETELQTSESQLKKWEEDLAAALSLSLLQAQSSRPALDEHQQLQRALEISALEALEHGDASRPPYSVDGLYDPEPEQPAITAQAPTAGAELSSPVGVPGDTQRPGLHAQLLQMMEPMSVGDLRKRAEQQGIAKEKIEGARDSRDPKSELSALIVCSIVAALRRGEEHNAPLVASSSSSPEEEMRAELEALDVGQLSRRAEASGIAAASIDLARDSHNPIRELMTLLLEQAAEHRAAGVNASEMIERNLDRLRVELASLDVSGLVHRAKEEGVESRLVNDARMRIDVAPAEALIALIVAKRGQAMGLNAASMKLQTPAPPPRPSPKRSGATAENALGSQHHIVRPNYAPASQPGLGEAANYDKLIRPAPAFQGP